MKRLTLFIAALSFAAIVSAQTSATTPTATGGAVPKQTAATAASATPATQVWYGCPKCDITSQKAGKCPKDGIALSKDHSYACPKCGMTADKAGKCTDGTTLVLVDCKAKMMNARKSASPSVTK